MTRWLKRLFDRKTDRIVSKEMVQNMQPAKVYNFWQLFQLDGANVIKTRVTVRIGKFQLLPGAIVNRGITIEGVDLFMLIGKNLQVRVLPGNVYWIVGVQNG